MVVFSKSFHPFLKQFTTDPETCANKMQRMFSHNPNSYGVTVTALFVAFDSGYYNEGYQETTRFIKLYSSYQDSYHDGGGSGSKEWFLFHAPQECPDEKPIEEKSKMSVRIPESDSYWTRGKHFFLLNPWGLHGVFEYYYYEDYKDDYESETEITEIGVRPSTEIIGLDGE